MKTQLLNKIYNVPITLSDEQFVKIGTDLDIYSMINSKVRSIDSVSVTVMDLMNARDNDAGRSFLIGTDSTGDYTFVGCTGIEFGDSTGKPYALYDATTNVFVGYYRLDPAAKVVQIADNSDIENDKEYVAVAISDAQTSLIPQAIKAMALLKVVLGKGIDKIMSLTQTDGTTNTVIDFSLLENQYTNDLVSVKVCTLQAKLWKRLQFPFYTSFAGTQYDAGEAVQITKARGTETLYMLVFFKDDYGNVSFPFVYVINP